MSKNLKNAVVVPGAPKPIEAFKSQLTLALPTLRHMIPSHISVEKFQSMMVTSVAFNHDLLECTTPSLLRATAQAAELGLSLNPSLKEADILPVYNKKLNEGRGGKEAQMRPRFGGLMKLARQSGDIKKIESVIVYERDYFKETRGTQERIEHEPYSPPPKRKVIAGLWETLKREPAEDEIEAEMKKHSAGFKTHVYCTWLLSDGTTQFEVMKADDVERIRARSPAATSGPWVSDEDEMWRKTVVRRASKYMPMSSETFRKAVALDDRADSETQDDWHGTFMDVTDDAPAPAATPSTTPAQTQTDALADRVAPRSPPPERLAVPDGFDRQPDYLAWRDDALALLGKLNPDGKVAWLKAHANILRDAPAEVAAAVRGVA